MRQSLRAGVLGFALVACVGGLARRGVAQAVSTAFTYQGQLQSAGAPANGNFDVRLTVMDAAVGGAALGTGAATFLNRVVTNGLVMLTPDFGPGVFNGATRYLQVEVRSAG